MNENPTVGISENSPGCGIARHLVTISDSGMVDNVLYQSGAVTGLSNSETSPKPDYSLAPEAGTRISDDTLHSASPEDEFLTTTSDSGMVDNKLYQLYRT